MDDFDICIWSEMQLRISVFVNRNSKLSLSCYWKHSRQKTHFPWGTNDCSVLRIVLCVSGGNVIVRENSCREYRYCCLEIKISYANEGV